MKTGKKLAALLLVLVMALSLTGCGSFQMQMVKTADQMRKTETCHADITVYADAALNVAGQELGAAITITGDTDIQVSPLLTRVSLTTEVLGVEVELVFYMEKDGDVLNVYVSKDDGSFEKTTTQQEEAEKPGMMQTLKLVMQCGDYFSEPVSDPVNGEEASRYDGVLPAEFVETMLDFLGWTDTFSNEDGTPLIGEDGLPVSLWINGDNRIVRVKTDLAPFVQKIAAEQLENVLGKYGLSGLNIGLELKSVDTDVVLSRYNEPVDIELPQ